MVPFDPVAPSFLDLKQVLGEEPPSIPWAVEGLLAEQDLAMVSGTGGIGKSYVLIALAISLASGRPLFKRFEVTKPYRTLYLDLEMAEYETRRRFHRMLKGVGEVPESLWVAPRSRLRLDKPPHVEQLAGLIEQFKIEFVLIDSYRRVYGGDDKDSMSSNAVFNALGALRSKFGVGAVFIAHWRKKSAENHMNDPGERLIGSVDHRNMIDCHITVERAGDDRLKITPEKSRHSNETTKENFEICFEHDDPNDDNGPFRLTYIPTGIDAEATKVLDLVRANGKVSYKWTEEHVQIHSKKLQRIARVLEAENLVERRKIGKEWYLCLTGQTGRGQ